MSKKKSNDQPQPQSQPEQEAPKTEQTLTRYFFPNVGEGKAFSVEAASFKDAVEANTQHLKETK